MYKTTIGTSPYDLVYGKTCHFLPKLEHKAYWAIKNIKLDLQCIGEKRLLQLNELDVLRNVAYENSRIYKEKINK